MGAGARGSIALAGWLAAAALAVTSPAAAQVRAGGGQADLTPPVGTPMFAYTERSGIANPGHGPEVLANLLADSGGNAATTFVPSRGIHTRLRARAIVLERNGRPFALVQADLGGLPYALVREVAWRVAPLGLAAEDILISATHTHAATGPIWPSDSTGYSLLGGDFFDRATFDLTVEAIAQAIVDAHRRLAPARVGVGTALVEDASRNRNIEPFRRNHDVPEDEHESLHASVDPEVTVVRVDREDGSPVGVWSSFAVHPTSFPGSNLLFSGDNAGYAARLAEQRIRREARRAGVPARRTRETVNVWTNGASGDIAPSGQPALTSGGEPLEQAPSDFARAHLVGDRVAAGIVSAWRRAGRSLRRDVPVDARRRFVAFDGTQADGEPVGPIPVLGFGGLVGPDGACAPLDGLAGPGQGLKMPMLAGVGLIPGTVAVSTWRVGDLAIVSAPVEMTRQMWLRIRSTLADRAGGAVSRYAMASMTNGYISYTATPEEYDACHYEGSFTLFGRRQGPRLLDAAAGAQDALLAGGAVESASEPRPGIPPRRPGRAVRTTPRAGEATEEPAELVRRFDRARFRWHGGDPLVDPPRERPFVRVQRRVGGEWRTASTEDGFLDTLELEDGVWTETFQVRECTTAGTYRFAVSGLADRGEGLAPYEVTSRPFRIAPRRDLAVDAPVVRGRRVLVRARYPEADEEALTWLPARVRNATARIEVRHRGRTRRVTARPNASGLVMAATVPRGARVRLLRVRDRCGNTGR